MTAMAPLISPADTAAQTHAFCVFCGRPHPSVWAPDDFGRDLNAPIKEPCSQGGSCATNFSGDGHAGRSHYGSSFDDDVFAVASGHAERFAGADPVCDACVGAFMLSGSIFNLGPPVEFGAASAVPNDQAECAKLAIDRKREVFLQAIARRRPPR